ncbi:MAG TPA: trehalose-phosphatase [Rhodanobacteraceae bacterium]|nr:trehalose-phosphatase [Rhodanobacteraceae bacterium]
MPLPLPPLPDPHARWAVFLDVDGTLLDFDDDPGAVRVGPIVLHTLAALRDALDGALALVSGRRLADLDRLIGASGWAAAGLHGLERRRADGRELDVRSDPATRDALRLGATALAAALPGVRLEDKGACIALHFREAPQHADALRRQVSELAAQLDGYEVQPGDHVFELKPAGIDKGRAIAAFLDEPPFAGRTPVYLGDDLTDEHAFAVVNARGGVSVRVGDRAPSAARFTLHNPAAVQTWLDRVLAHLT